MGRGIGRQAGKQADRRRKGKEAAPIKLSSYEDTLSEKSNIAEDEIWIEKRWKREGGSLH